MGTRESHVSKMCVFCWGRRSSLPLGGRAVKHAIALDVGGQACLGEGGHMRLPEFSAVSPGEDVVAVNVDPEDVRERPAVGDERLSHRVRCVLRSGEDELIPWLLGLRVPHVLRQQRPCQLIDQADRTCTNFFGFFLGFFFWLYRFW